MKTIKLYLIGALLFMGAHLAQAAGLLTPTNSSSNPLTIREHHVNVTINHGYATTSVEQIFFNPNPQDLEAIYSFPVPDKAAVGEFTYWIDGKPVTGEVVEKQKAKQIYEQEKQAGRETALVEKDSHKTFDISVSPVRANSEVRIRLVYIQAAHVDTSIGRYIYPLEDGGVDEVKNAFWSRNDAVKEKFSFNIDLHSSYPVDAVRLPQHPNATVKQIDKKRWNINITNHASNTSNGQNDDINLAGQQPISSAEIPTTPNTQNNAANLNEDIVLYWRLQNGLPGALDMVTYKEENQSIGTFMLTLTPGDDLKAIQQGSDWIFVLDISGSMNGKFASLTEGVRQGLKKLRTTDRFKVVLFNNNAIDFTQGFLPVDQTNVKSTLNRLSSYGPNGGTNLYAGLKQGVSNLDADRSSAIILVTDGVANVGITEKKAFIKLLKKNDIRLFTFVMGNSTNKPLLEEMTRVSSGFAQSISNADDIGGQIQIAAKKMVHQAFRDVSISIDGVRTNNLTPEKTNSLYHGEQLTILGHYSGVKNEASSADITIKAKVGSETKIYKTTMRFPAVDNTHPELERLWAYGTIEHLQSQLDYYGSDAQGSSEAKDMEQAITDTAIKYGLVTDYTSMLVVREEVLQQLGITASNKLRVEKENKARDINKKTKAQQQNVSQAPRPVTGGNQSGGGGGGSTSLLLSLLMLMIIFVRRSKLFITKK